MAMDKKGLTKLIEECGELIQIAAKKSAYMNDTIHPDGQNIDARLEEEIADVLASIKFVSEKFNLNNGLIEYRKMNKLNMFGKYDKES